MPINDLQLREAGSVTLHVHGIPKGQPRPRAFARRIGAKFTARMYDPGTAEGWKSCIAAAAHGKLPKSPIEGPVSVSMVCYMPRPARLCRKRDPVGMLPCLSKPDVDNLFKCVDALTQAGAWRDDAQIIHSECLKVYAARDGKPGAVITIKWFEKETRN